MKIVLFGEDIFTAAALESLLTEGHVIAAVICPVYNDNQEYRSIQKAAGKKNIPFLHQKNVNSDQVRNYLLNIAPDLIVCVHLRKILQKSIFSLPPKGTINIHPSLLPKYRGLSPQHQAILHGDKETGVTVHFIDEGVDTGPIIIQKNIPLSEKTYIYDLQMEMLAAYKHLIPEAIELISSKDFQPLKQKAGTSSYYGALKDSDREIDLKKTTFEIYNLIRAVSKPYKGAYYKDVTIWTSFIADNPAEKQLIKEYPNTGIYMYKNQLVIRLHDGFLISDDFEVITR